MSRLEIYTQIHHKSGDVIFNVLKMTRSIARDKYDSNSYVADLERMLTDESFAVFLRNFTRSSSLAHIKIPET